MEEVKKVYRGKKTSNPNKSGMSVNPYIGPRPPRGVRTDSSTRSIEARTTEAGEATTRNREKGIWVVKHTKAGPRVMVRKEGGKEQGDYRNEHARAGLTARSQEAEI